MPLSNLVFTAGQQPNYMQAGFQAASLMPNLADQFNKGMDAATKRQQDLLAYQVAKQKADLYAAIAPELAQYQKAELQRKIALMNGMSVDPYAQSGTAAFVPAGTIKRTAPSGEPAPTDAPTPATPTAFPYQSYAGASPLTAPNQNPGGDIGLFGTPGSQFLPPAPEPSY